ncbi:MAG: hypothetical protein U9R28_01290 [Pseudomonadota bacterium]|nr:hypothetical protein [Pseudomonadota bacterium]
MILPAHSTPVNINISAPQDIAKALNGVDLSLAEKIAIHCEVTTCRLPADLLAVEGVSTSLLEEIKQDLIFNIIQRGMDLDDDC